MPLHNVNVFGKMKCWITLFYVFVSIAAVPNEDTDYCEEIKCIGVEYECIDGRCYCAPGYIPNHLQVRCVKCPELGEKCNRQCCNLHGNDTLHCWQGICQPCHDAYGNWVCSRENMKDVLLISSAQIAMGAALVFGIIATFILLYKLCAATTVRPYGRASPPARLSIGSLQVYVDERLRDAPPRYTRQPASGSSIYPASAYLNNGFVHDSSLPPPPYSPPDDKPEEIINTGQNLHI